MHVTNYSVLYPALLEGFNADEFLIIKKNKKKLKLLKAALGASYAMLVSAVYFGSTEIGFTIIVAALVLIFYFQNKIKRCLEIISQDNTSIEVSMRPYVNSTKLYEFRNLQLDNMMNGKISKTEYLDVVKEDVLLHFSLIKKDCSEEINIDVVNYKSSIEKLFASAYDAANKGYLDIEEVHSIEKKWSSDLQVLCNQYAKTDLEVEIKYLYIKSGTSK